MNVNGLAKTIKKNSPISCKSAAHLLCVKCVYTTVLQSP